MSATRRTIGALALTALTRPAIAAPSALEALFAPSAKLWDRWTPHDEASRQTVDHAAWTAILHGHVRRMSDGATRFAYRAMTQADRAALKAYVTALEAVPVAGLNRAEQFAYWTNLYNALTVQVVTDHYPVASIRDIGISPGVFASGPWGAKLATVGGQPVTLNDIEHRILRPIWRDPRVHYAVNCASIGCPDLAPEAYAGISLDRQLDAAAASYVGHARGVSVAGDGVTLSSIYNWFTEDFSGDGGVLPHLVKHAPSPLAATLRLNPKIRGYQYDWSLNDAA